MSAYRSNCIRYMKIQHQNKSVWQTYRLSLWFVAVYALWYNLLHMGAINYQIIRRNPVSPYFMLFIVKKCNWLSLSLILHTCFNYISILYQFYPIDRGEASATLRMYGEENRGHIVTVNHINTLCWAWRSTTTIVSKQPNINQPIASHLTGWIVQEPKWGPGNVWEYKVLWLILNLYVYWRKLSLVATTATLGNYFYLHNS